MGGGTSAWIFDPLIKCGQQSLRVFCVGVLLSFVGYFLIAISSGTLLNQALISAGGIAILCGLAYYGDWSKPADRIAKGPPTVGGSEDVLVRTLG